MQSWKEEPGNGDGAWCRGESLLDDDEDEFAAADGEVLRLIERDGRLALDWDLPSLE